MYAAVGIIKKVPFTDARTLEVYSVGGLSADIACDAVITSAMLVLLNRKRTAYDRCVLPAHLYYGGVDLGSSLERTG